MAIIGGGIVGLATAYALSQRAPRPRVLLLEKEDAVARHQSGHNSGVLHAGVYYAPGSLKARLCRSGKNAMERFCTEHGIAWTRCGKVVVAVDEDERSRLHALARNAQTNGVTCELIGPERLAELEPHAAGVEALHMPETGVVDYGVVCTTLQRLLTADGQPFVFGARVLGLAPRGDATVIETTTGTFAARAVINCAGLHADRVARSAGSADLPARIVPFRGEYAQLVPERRHLCRALIYPVPDPALPFLGVHVTRTVNGSVTCGPTAVLAFAREGYRRANVHPGDLVESLAYRGMRRLARRHWRTGLAELARSSSRSAFARAAQRLIPELEAGDLRPAPAGVRAQAVTPDGELSHDFLLLQDERARLPLLHVLNAPSPAATASLAIGQQIAALIPTSL